MNIACAHAVSNDIWETIEDAGNDYAYEPLNSRHSSDENSYSSPTHDCILSQKVIPSNARVISAMLHARKLWGKKRETFHDHLLRENWIATFQIGRQEERKANELRLIKLSFVRYLWFT